jgi:hypothetical protein
MNKFCVKNILWLFILGILFALPYDSNKLIMEPAISHGPMGITYVNNIHINAHMFYSISHAISIGCFLGGGWPTFVTRSYGLDFNYYYSSVIDVNLNICKFAYNISRFTIDNCICLNPGIGVRFLKWRSKKRPYVKDGIMLLVNKGIVLNDFQYNNIRKYMLPYWINLEIRYFRGYE